MSALFGGSLSWSLREQRLDARGVRDALIELERDLGRDAQTQRATDARAQVPRDAAEPSSVARAPPRCR